MVPVSVIESLRKQIASCEAQLQDLRQQLEEAEKAAVAAAESSASEQAAEVLRLRRELSAANDEATALKEVLAVQKDSISEMSQNHSTELELAAKARAEEVTKLRTEYEDEKATLLQEKTTLASRVSDNAENTDTIILEGSSLS